MEKRIPILIIFMLFYFPLFAQMVEKVEVMTLGTFHFDFPNKDAVKIDKNDQIDVLDTKHQTEIDKIVDRLAAFKPSIIAIERRPEEQSKIDSLYQKYRKGEYKLERSEDQQIGFKLARKLGLDTIYAVDEWGKPYKSVREVLNDSTKAAEFKHFYFNNPDTHKKYTGGRRVFATEGILAELIQLNQPERIKESLGDYLIGHFKFEYEKGDYFGVDFETGRWFNRNLRIFRNIQRINTKDDDRILIIFGAGHLNLLNILFEASPEYTLISPLRYLKK